MKKIYLIVLFILMVIQSGCGNQGENRDTGEAQSVQVVERDPFDWKTQPIARNEEVVESSQYYSVSTYIDLCSDMPQEVAEDEYPEYVVYGNHLFGLFTYGEYPDFGHQLLQVNGSTGKVSWEAFEPVLRETQKATGESKEWSSCYLAGIAGEDLVLSEYVFDSGKREGTYRMTEYNLYYVDREGRVKDKMNIVEGYELLHMIRDEDCYLLPGDCLVDADGSAYILSTDRNQLCRVDREGKATIVADYGEYGNAQIDSGRASDGQLVFTALNKQENVLELFWIDENGEQKVIYQMPRQTMENVCLNQTGQCFYIQAGESLLEKSRKIICWDLSTGEQTPVFDLWENGLGTLNRIELNCSDDGKLYLHVNGLEKALIVLDENGMETEQELVFAGPDNTFFKSCAASYSRKHPDISIRYREIPSEEETERLKTDIVAGKGPDIMVLDGDEMKLFWEKGILADISDYLKEETRQQIWKGILEAGKLDSSLVGIGTSYYIRTLITANDTWEKDTWTMEDFIGILKSDQKFEHVLASSGGSADIVLSTLLYDLNGTPFYDEQNKECNFVCDDFIFLLEYIKENGDSLSRPSVRDRTRAVVDENCMVADTIISFWGDGLPEYSSYMNYTGDDSHIVGYPTDKGNGNFLNVNNFLTVNSQTKNPKLAADFLEYIFSFETQRQSDNILRKDILRQCVGIDYDGRAVLKRDGYYELLDSRKDGTSYLEEYIQFMEDCEPCILKQPEIRSILAEELGAYVGSNQSAEETAELIQNRISLYLEEQ